MEGNKCRLCGNVLVRGPQAIFCGKYCRTRASQIRRQGSCPLGVCAWCGGLFRQRQIDHRFCNAYCKSAEWRASNPERSREQGRRYRRRHPERSRQSTRQWRARNPERVAAQTRAWFEDNPGARGIYNHRRDDRVKDADHLSVLEWQILVEQYGGRCAYCGAETQLTIDHRIPLSRGGSNTISNVLPACRRCNARKHDSDELEFRAILAFDEFVAGRQRRNSGLEIREPAVVFSYAPTAGRSFGRRALDG